MTTIDSKEGSQIMESYIRKNSNSKKLLQTLNDYNDNLKQKKDAEKEYKKLARIIQFENFTLLSIEAAGLIAIGTLASFLFPPLLVIPIAYTGVRAYKYIKTEKPNRKQRRLHKELEINKILRNNLANQFLLLRKEIETKKKVYIYLKQKSDKLEKQQKELSDSLKNSNWFQSLLKKNKIKKLKSKKSGTDELGKRFKDNIILSKQALNNNCRHIVNTKDTIDKLSLDIATQDLSTKKKKWVSNNMVNIYGKGILAKFVLPSAKEHLRKQDTFINNELPNRPKHDINKLSLANLNLSKEKQRKEKERKEKQKQKQKRY